MMLAIKKNKNKPRTDHIYTHKYCLSTIANGEQIN